VNQRDKGNSEEDDDMTAGQPGQLVDEARLGRFLDEKLGGREATTVEKHIAGFSNETFYVYRGDARYVLRRPPRGPLLPTAHDVAREYRFLHALHGTAARVPRPVVLCEDAEVIGAPFSLLARKDGLVIRDQMPAALDSADDRRQVGLEMIDALAELHGVDWEATGLQGRPGGFLDRQLKRWESQADLTVGKVRELPGLSEVTAWLKRRKPSETRSTVVHGDYKLDNVMFAPDAPAQLIAIFDWEMATIGDPLADLGWLMHTWGKPDVVVEGDALPLTAEEGFATREELAARYADRTGRTMDDFTFYHVMALWKMAIILEGLYVGYRTGTASNPAAAEFEFRVPRLIERARMLMAR
jgi:aminoglycoside phosphotransferase (APT) family kinase protein